MLAKHPLPHSREPREQPRSLDGEQVFADFSLLLGCESHVVHRSTAFRTRGQPD